MFFPTPPLLKSASGLRRLRLTTKMVNGGYYKGNRTGPMGWHTKWGGYIIDPRLVRTYVYPDRKEMEECKLTPFVSKGIKKPKWNKMSAKSYLMRWKNENGID